MPKRLVFENQYLISLELLINGFFFNFQLLLCIEYRLNQRFTDQGDLSCLLYFIANLEKSDQIFSFGQ